ncbi:beta-ketoacyl synthase N-terminal-like domain-containing protein [Saccharothrix sp. BKS2]|uniref:beta-ketoacyl-[acyl-carrier-protein] synthase family protein n=1 Tax=Saccharothrix sp. BKS2 TaxID=3064400 RepID=UPI0039E8D075
MTWDITGLGAVASVGDTPEEVYEALCAGRSGVSGLQVFDTSKYRARHAYEIDDRATPGVDEPLRATKWLGQVVGQALDDAGLPRDGDYPVLVGTTLRELRSAELWWRHGTPVSLPDLHFGGALRTGFGTTESHTVASACAASLYALGMATDMIELGLADTVVVAGTDSITESSYGALDRLQNLTPEAVRPFHADRRGMLMGEGAVAVVVRRSGAGGRVRARVRGVSMNCDGAHPTMPDVAGIVRAIREAHDRAKVRPEDIDLVITHGSGTKQNDLAETVALEDVFAAVAEPPFVTSVKSGAGHTCGGSGLLSLVVAVLSLDHGAVPPIIGLDDRMEEAADLRLVHGEPARGDLSTAQVHSIGLGGINAVAIVERVA